MVVTSSLARAGRRLWPGVLPGLVLGAALVLAACDAGAASPAASVDPVDGVTIENAAGLTVAVVYEAPDGATEQITELDAGESIVIGAIFDGRDGLCRTGRLFARTADGAEVDELYLVCRDRTWTIEPS
jgi:hypothetical protein